ncbi:NADPH-dependent 2,4-dienoyl-CoA reductase/sulfur reductase-like enzyme [Halanaerobium saccharolyticum]|uniref:NADPH-dependent 2,4-dienoyl-CoA reductase/sulfur reductase-like enzyme n=1 Tax=Halanaerobium saccharolyticum TaxID=43595 RepID=A0A4R7YL22_9FIRM|nr:FAD-dependent oxidoreductase [Halanaerobium saccharolyticum]RAK03957.1 NADPH-dependent 2,4-dienoyl-CoA reductase/sulfur reductase-like enzyme [Halanaerobium saccharolyticum]TDV97309.1 NADPH-dependent 2,4-dienoyl-CoA reductase/sulfur reductase-like enzyme [Halanaerobium saccharolyticum]TDX49043.1 NADPH-dependent 2,4-dienoyl-CoA reductase/sulfur reductase-like enzyme [Halanaerobium saccharolyticum]
MNSRIVIVGASDVGISTGLRIRELDRSIKPLVIADNNFPNFSICGIPFFLGGEVEKWQDLAHRKKSDLRKAGLELLLETRVEKILPEAKKILIKNNDGVREIKYDKLVLGTGGINIEPPIKGLELDEVFFMRWMQDAVEFDNFITQKNPRRAVIVGGGYVGLEMADALTKRGLEVTVIEFLDSILSTVCSSFRKRIKDKLEENGVKVILNTEVKEIKKSDGELIIKGSQGFSAAADTVVISVGTKANSQLAAGTSLELNDDGTYSVNSRLETNIEDIYAGGDCVQSFNYLSGENKHYALGTVAHKHGRIIGSNICGREEEFAGAIGTQSIKLFDQVVARTGLNLAEAEKAGFEPRTVEIEARDHKIYYPPAYKTYLRVIADSKSGRILGAQILGNVRAEISKRIDIFSAAIYNEMTCAEFSQLDLSYTPPLSSPWDPVQKAVQELELILD